MKVMAGILAAGLLVQFAAAAAKTDAVTEATTKYTSTKADLKKIVTGKKILVVYYSKSGNTERVALDIADSFGADVEKLVDQKARGGFWNYLKAGRDAMKKRLTTIDPVKHDAAKYDIIIIGSPVWGWNMTPAVRTYIDQNKAKFKNVAFFVTAGGTTAENVVPSMEEASGKKCVSYTGFVSRELKNKDVYWNKLTKFLESFKKK
jgi:flavodoxin